MPKFRVTTTDTNLYSRLVEAKDEDEALEMVRVGKDGYLSSEDQWGEFMDGVTSYDVMPVREDSI
jgi:hypothetical protein